MTTNNNRLRELMDTHGLYKADVAGMLHLAITSTGQVPAVNKWLASEKDKGNFRKMGDAHLELLEIKLGERRVRRFRSRRKKK